MNSLAVRLLVAAGVVLVAFVALTALALDHAVAERGLKAEHNKLQGLTYALLGRADISDDGRFRLPTNALPDADLSRPGSDMTALVANADGKIVWQSPSLIDPIALPPAPAVGQWRFIPAYKSVDNRVKLAFGLRWVAGNDRSYRFTLLVAENGAPIRAEYERFRSGLWTWLSLSAALLLILQLVILRWGLAPLRRVARGLRRVETGEAERIEGNYPAELRPLIDGLNAMIAGEKARMQRYRNALADLAHSLKTPIAVLRGLTGDDTPLPPEPRKQLRGQLARINEIVDYQLQRAAAAGTRSLAPPVAVRPTAERVAGALRKVYAQKRVDIQIDIPENLGAAVDAGDLTEILGNLMDNAAKYGGAKLRVGGKADNRGVEITVDDNGPGFPAGDPDNLLARGVRADSRREGQGIGLAVTAEIVRAYAGGIYLEAAPDGGGRVRLRLPR